MTKEIKTFANNCYLFLAACIDKVLDDEKRNLYEGPDQSNLRHALYTSIQSVKDRLAALVKSLTDLELQYWAWQISKDLGLSVILAPHPAPRFVTRPLTSQVELPEQLLPTLAQEAKATWSEIEATRIRVLHVANPSLKQVLSWTIIVHEAAHQIPGLQDFVKELAEDSRAKLSHGKLLELSADLIAAQYLGPSFCFALARFAELIRPAGGAVHPVMKTRLQYLTSFLNRELEKTKGKISQDVHREIIELVLKDLETRLPKWKAEDEEESQLLLARPDAPLFQKVEEFAKTHLIVNWSDQLAKDLALPPFKEWTPQYLHDELQRLAGKRVMLAVHPSSSFNLVILLPRPMMDQEPVVEAVRTSIRKYMIATAFDAELKAKKANEAAMAAQAVQGS